MSPPVPSAPFIGKPLPRVDGRAKVTGAAKYAAEGSAEECPVRGGSEQFHCRRANSAMAARQGA